MSSILAIDQGTTSTKALLIDGEDCVGSAVEQVGRTYPRPGWVEQDPEELWQSVVVACSRLPPSAIGAVAVAAQRESLVVWDRHSSRPLAPCVSWQSSRGAEICARSSSAMAAVVRERTGLPLDSMFTAVKLRALVEQDSAVRRAIDGGSALVGTVDCWLAWKLTGRHVTDAGNASRTLLFDLDELDWNDELLQLFEVPRHVLPTVVASGDVLGEVTGLGMASGIPLAALAADSHAAMLGVGCTRPGRAKATYGTGTSLMSPTGASRSESGAGLSVTLAWLTRDAGPTYALEGNAYSTGATVAWAARLLGLADSSEVASLARSVVDSGGVHLVPAFAGLGAPYWRSGARGQISGLSFSSGPAEVARASIDSIAFQVADLVEALERDLGTKIEELLVDGGAAQDDDLLQLQADLIGRPVVRVDVADAAAVGVAHLALLATGSRSADSFARHAPARRAEPQMAEEQRLERLSAWHAAVASAG